MLDTMPAHVVAIRRAMVEAAKRAGLADAMFRIGVKVNARGETVLAIIFRPDAKGWTR